MPQTLAREQKSFEDTKLSLYFSAPQGEIRKQEEDLRRAKAELYAHRKREEEELKQELSACKQAIVRVERAQGERLWLELNLCLTKPLPVTKPLALAKPLQTAAGAAAMPSIKDAMTEVQRLY